MLPRGRWGWEEMVTEQRDCEVVAGHVRDADGDGVGRFWGGIFGGSGQAHRAAVGYSRVYTI